MGAFGLPPCGGNSAVLSLPAFLPLRRDLASPLCSPCSVSRGLRAIAAAVSSVGITAGAARGTAGLPGRLGRSSRSRVGKWRQLRSEPLSPPPPRRTSGGRLGKPLPSPFSAFSDPQGCREIPKQSSLPFAVITHTCGATLGV